MKCELCGRKQLCEKCGGDKYAELRATVKLIRPMYAKLEILRKQYSMAKSL